MRLKGNIKKTGNKRVFIIAEAGVNHNGSLKVAKRMIEAAVEAGADAVKFQTFKTENVISASAPKADYQKKSTCKNESQFEMVKKLELSATDFNELCNYCKKKRIIFLSTPFDLESIDLLKKLGVGIFKIPSGEITNLPYLRKVGSLKKRLVMSTGMSTLPEIKRALDVLVAAGTRKRNITILHCNSEYPTPMKDANLRAMLTIKDRFKVVIGYSDHTLGIEVPIAAAALGASVIEKHLTLNKRMNGPDHRASLDPHEFRAMVASIRNIEKAIGNGIKNASDSERKNRCLARKSIVASRCIKKGERFTDKNLMAKRPATGISPMAWDKVVGKVARKCFKTDENIFL